MTSRSRQPHVMRKYAKLYRAGYRLTVDPLGVQRRLQALMSIGYTRADMARGTGLSKNYIRCLLAGSEVRISRSTDEAVREFYRLRSVQPLHTTNGNRARTWARKNGYAPPAAWDDIDDPEDEPKGVKWPTKCSVCRAEEPLRRGMCRKDYARWYRQQKREGRAA